MSKRRGTGSGSSPDPHPSQSAQPWARLRGESRKAFQALLAYRDLGPDRSLREAAAHVGKHVSLLKRWSRKYLWQERVEAWDQHERQETEAATHQARQSAYERRVANAEQLEKVAMAGLRSLMVRDPETGEVRFDKRLKPAEIAALIRVAFRIFPTQLPALDSPAGDEQPEALGRLRDEDIQTLLALLEEPSEPEEDPEDD